MNSLFTLEAATHGDPLRQDLILGLILEVVGRGDIDDLLGCRLVSHAWNRASVRVLERQHGYAVELDYEELLAFKSLLWNSKVSRMKSEGQELESLRLSLTLFPKKCTEEHGSEIAGSAQLLELHPHLRLALLSIEYDEKDGQPDHGPWYTLANFELFTLLKMASADLTTFTIVEEQQISPHFDKFDFDSYLDLEFPRLATLNYAWNSSCSDSKDQLLDLTEHMVHVIKQAPKLIKVTLDLSDPFMDQDYTTVKPSRRILESCSANLEELELEFSNAFHEYEDILRQIKFPKLRLLTAKEITWTNTWNEFVQFNCPVLTQISISLDLRCVIAEDELNEDFPNFPLLQNISRFELYPDSLPSYPTEAEAGYPEYICAIFSQIFLKLTSLKVLGLDFGLLFILGAHLKESGHLIPPANKYPVFPAISTLEIHISFVETKMFDVLDMTTSIYHHTFPNLKTLIIKPDTSRNEKKLELLERAMEFLCFHPRIQDLEIHNYAQDWLAQPSVINHSFPELKRLRLLAAPMGEEGPHVNLMDVVARFPALEFLQLGKGQASATEIQELRKLTKRFDNSLTRNHKRNH